MKFKIFLLGIVLMSVSFSSCKKAAASKEVKKRYQLWQSKTDAGWKDVRKVSYTYNSQGRLQVEIAERIITPDSTEYQYRIETTYDEEGKEIKIFREHWNVNHWIFSLQSRFEYEGDQIVRRVDSIARGRGEVIDLTDYEYDSKGFLIAEITYNKKDSLKAFPRKVTYTNNANGDPTLKDFPVFKNGEWIQARRMILEYNASGHHIKTTRYNFRNNSWTVFVDYELEVDAEGNRRSELWKRPTNEGTEEFMKVLYHYE